MKNHEYRLSSAIATTEVNYFDLFMENVTFNKGKTLSYHKTFIYLCISSMLTDFEDGDP